MKMNTTSFETRIRITAQKTKYAEMTNSSKECMRDRLNTEVHNPNRIWGSYAASITRNTRLPSNNSR